jgi:fumarate reductase subunit C
VITETKPKELIRPMPKDWWLKNPVYFKFMMRELTGLVIAFYCIFLLVMMSKAEHADAASFAAFYGSLGSPLSVAFHIVVFAFAVYHSTTFFDLTPRVLVVFRGEEKVPEAMIAGAHYVAWAVVSLILIIIALTV